MQKKHKLHFSCQSCQHPVYFSIFDLDERDALVHCSQCSKKYAFHDEILKRQLKKFEALCVQLVDSEEILSNTAVGIDIGEHHVKVPYKLLLTRLNSSLELMIGNQPVSIAFRMEPTKDFPIALMNKVSEKG